MPHSGKRRQDLREYSPRSGRMLQALGHWLQRVGFRCRHRLFSFRLWLFCAPVLHQVPSLPQQGAGRINTSKVFTLWNGGMFDLLFSEMDAHCFWEPGLPGQLRWRRLAASQAVHGRSGSDVVSPALGSASLSSSFVHLNQGCFEAGTISHRCLLHGESSVSGASRHRCNKNNKLFGWQISDTELSVPGSRRLCQRCRDTGYDESCYGL